MQRLMLAAALSAFAFAAVAQTPSPAPQAGGTAQAKAQAGVVAADARADAGSRPANKKANDAQCLRQTGSRIQSRAKGDCAAYGRSYDRNDLNRTGEIDTASALRRLDPSVH